MKVSIVEIETKGLRCPDSLIKLTDRDTGSAVNLIQMPNGTGKTTIIELIIGTLTGKAAQWTPTEVSDFQGQGRSDIDNGEFKLTLSIKEKNKYNKTIVLFLMFDFISNSIKVSTMDDKEGFLSGWIIPREIAPFFEENCVDVFVFKGDKTDDIVTRGRGNAQPAIKTFFGISALDNLQDKIKDDFNEKMRGIQTNIGHNRATNRKEALLEKWILRLDNLKTVESKLQEKKRNLDIEYKEISTNYENIIQQVNLIERRHELKEIRDQKKNNLYNDSVKVLNFLRDPFSFSSSIYDDVSKLRETLDDLQLPGASRSFFEQWIDKSDVCICGSDLTQEKREEVMKSVESFLADDDINIIENIKNEVLESDDRDKSINLLKNSFNNLIKSNEEYVTADYKYTTHIRELEAGVHPDSQVIIDNYHDIIKEQTLCDAKLHTLNNKDVEVDYTDNIQNSPEACKNIKIAQKVIELISAELGKLKNMKNIVDAKSTLVNIIEKTSKDSLKKFKNHLVNETNNKLKKYLRDGSEIEVLNIDKNVQLGWEKKEKKKGSGAQNSIAIYSFATSILERANINFPLIVDHPVTNMDSNSRKHVGEKLSEISHQFIGFVIDIEKPHFLPALETNGDIHYISLFSKISGNESYIDQVVKQPDSHKYESENGFISYDKDFFHNNQMGTNV